MLQRGKPEEVFCLFRPSGASEFSRPWESEGPHPSGSKAVQWKETGPRPSRGQAHESSQSFEWPQTQEYGFCILERWTHSGYQRRVPPPVLMSSAWSPHPSSGKTASSSQGALAQITGLDRMAAGLFQWMEPYHVSVHPSFVCLSLALCFINIWRAA